MVRAADGRLAAALAARVVSAAAELAATVDGQHAAHDVSQVRPAASASSAKNVAASCAHSLRNLGFEDCV